ncbi:hypothetical protein A9Q95_10590 [Rhodobacterales bacterium 59_46_T64]|nr:hypothetical protein A9Q95_10590 [Rhodobacterales bacterium 59_46_T64]
MSPAPQIRAGAAGKPCSNPRRCIWFLLRGLGRACNKVHMKHIYSIRPASAPDAFAIATIQAGLWRPSYQGVLPDALIERMENVGPRKQAWTTIFQHFEESGLGGGYVAEIEGGDVVGFGTCGPQRDEALRDEGYEGEITSLYVAQDHQRCGLGAALLRFIAADMNAHAPAAAFWILDGNASAEAFFAQSGAVPCATRTSEMGDISETAYGWRDLSVLIGPVS